MKTVRLFTTLLMVVLCVGFIACSSDNEKNDGALFVKTAGTLPTLISSADKNLVTDLTLSGNLNGTDIKYIREMAGGGIDIDDKTAGKLTRLNLADAKIVEGGDYYYDNERYCYTENNSISDGMFVDLKNLTSIILPNNITSIGNFAFSGCTGLTSIVIPNSVISIGNESFADCTGLTAIAIPNKVTSIGNYAFVDCKGLKEVHSKSLTPPIITDINNYTFGDIDKTVCKLYVPKGSLSKYKVATGWSSFTTIIEE